MSIIFLKTATINPMIGTIEYSTIPPSIFFVPSCPDPNTIGPHCNISAHPCDMLKPCQNSGSCINTNTTLQGYICRCLSGFDGTQCQLDNRPCKPNTCWNNGTCNETSNTTFECFCENDWTGTHCEVKVNCCENVTFLNKGICIPLFLNYTCECLGTNYSGRHSEIVEDIFVFLQIVRKSFGYIVILFLIAVVLFIVVMDVLKYGFGIDPTKDELDKIRRAK